MLVENGFGMSRDKVIKLLEAKKIETRPFFIPMNKQPVFRDMSLFAGEDYPVAERLSQCGLNLPSSSGLSRQEIECVCASLAEARSGSH